MSSFNFEFLKKTRSRSLQKFLTLDKHNRIMLSKGYRKDTAPVETEKEIPFNVYFVFDKAHKMVGVLRQDSVKEAAGDLYKIDKRGYAHAPDIYEQFGLDPKKGPYRFEFVQKADHNGYYFDAFRLVTSE